MNNDVLTVRQFAKIAGVSYQSVYKRINHPDSTIQPYIVNRVNPQGKRQTYLDISILDDPDLNPSSQPVNPRDSQPVNPATVNPSTVDSQPINPQEDAEEQPEAVSGDDLTAFLKSQIEIKDKLIQELTERLQAAQESNAETLKSLQFEQGKNRDLSEKLLLLQAPDPQPEQNPDPPKERFIDKVKTWWNSTYHID